MRKAQKQMVLELIQTLYEAHEIIKNNIVNNEIKNAQSLLNECKEAIDAISSAVSKFDVSDLDIQKKFEDYRLALLRIDKKIDNISAEEVYNTLNLEISKANESIKNEKIKFEVVFMPYKASMWDSLESIWEAAKDDPNCIPYVVPIPYYDKKPDGSLGEFHYEGLDYPSYVPILDYTAYKVDVHCPDVIYIHNPYDEYNYVTTVAPQFYSHELKKYTDMLVYVPYFVLPKNDGKMFANTSGVMYSDKVIVQNDIIREQHIEVLKDRIPVNVLENKIVTLGSPKIDKIIKTVNQEMEYPSEWIEKIEGKKVVFFNTNVSLILKNGDKFIGNLRRIFDIFKKHKDEYIVLWREHPLSIGTIKSMRPGLLNDYNRMKKSFIDEGIGFFDETPEAYQAMKISDCYFGAGGSLTAVYAATGKPIMITDYNYPMGIIEENTTVEEVLASLRGRTHYNERHINSLDLFLDNLEVFNTQKEERLKAVSSLVGNLEGNVGNNINNYVKNLLCED